MNPDLSRTFSSSIQSEILEFAQALVRIQSYSSQEEEAIRFVAQKMKALGYDEVRIDAMGNVLGRIGKGKKTLLFDAHVDTVAVHDEKEWSFPPFGGQIVSGWLQGRGAVDMKSAVAASVYAGAIAKQKNYTTDKTLLVSTTVNEEDCDGENLKHLFKEFSITPDYVVICEPSNNNITLGHKGKAQVAITTQGVSAHGAAPEKGRNAVYEMAKIIQEVEKLNTELPEKNNMKGTLVLSKISSQSASLNAVPTQCEIYLDRRMILGETKADIQREMEKLIQDKHAEWKIGTLKTKSWKGLEIHYKPFHPAWKIDRECELTQACIIAYQKCFGKEPSQFDYWDFSTNAVTPVSMGIPTIGFGPGDYRQAHMRDEQCPVGQIIRACEFYVDLSGVIFSMA